ncbi:hypothetical protein [uncultured Acetobacteroides sp.]|uniref:hypothetical protein n=1 Tax=uncultured Acetobacteroides sp. TaxID=1760811 RepID=UPI0029F50A52|nr:hypothetical protein [uncultured Acetobacteroides sp.]
MLRLLKLTLVIAIASLIVSCDKEKQENSQLLEGSTWKLKAYINTTNGDVQFVSNAHPVEMSFLKGGKYTFSSDSKCIQSTFRFRSETGCASFSKPSKSITFSRETNTFLTATFKSDSYELVGDNLKIASKSTNKFLIFERIR